MVDKFTFRSAGEIQEVEFALARHGWTHSLLTKATGGEFFGLVREVLEGRAEICRIEHLTAESNKIVASVNFHLINCDADPFVPSGLKVKSHQKGGKLVFDAKKIELYLSETQKSGHIITSNKLLKELANKPVLNACVLDYLLANQHLIPDEWKGKAVCFFGTVYYYSIGRVYFYVRYLYWRGKQWGSSYRRFENGWLGNDPVAVLAS